MLNGCTTTKEVKTDTKPSSVNIRTHQEEHVNLKHKLPKDADFTRMTEQAVWFASGSYLNKKGMVKSLTSFAGATNYWIGSDKPSPKTEDASQSKIKKIKLNLPK